MLVLLNKTLYKIQNYFIYFNVLYVLQFYFTLFKQSRSGHESENDPFVSGSELN